MRGVAFLLPFSYFFCYSKPDILGVFATNVFLGRVLKFNRGGEFVATFWLLSATRDRLLDGVWRVLSFRADFETR